MSLPSSLPASRVPDPLAAPTMRWGILGTGWIAGNFVAALRARTRQEIVAVGSRSIASGQSFADACAIGRAYGSYEDLVADPSIDVVYVATPHNFHVEHGLLAIEAGKHVLIEKPMALNLGGVRELFAAADRHGVMCQEAFWSFFLPKFDVIRQLLDERVLGDITTVLADHGEWLPPEHRIHDPNLAGGSLHDLGVYVFALSAFAAGRPNTVKAVGKMTSTGVMGDAAFTFGHPSGAVSSLSTTMTATTPCRGVLAGSSAMLETTDAFFFPGDFTVRDYASGSVLSWNEPNDRHGSLHFEAAEVARRISQGDTESPCWSRRNSLDVAHILDEVNYDLGLA